MLKTLFCTLLVLALGWAAPVYADQVDGRLQDVLNGELQRSQTMIEKACQRSGLPVPRNIIAAVVLRQQDRCLIALYFSSFVPAETVHLLSCKLGTASIVTLDSLGLSFAQMERMKYSVCVIPFNMANDTMTPYEAELIYMKNNEPDAYIISVDAIKRDLLSDQGVWNTLEGTYYGLAH